MSKRSEWCRHFTGIQNKVCNAGISYDSVRVESSRPYRWPCILGGGDACDKKELFTGAESAAHEATLKTHFDNTLKARAAVVATKERLGTISCPCCEKGELRFAIASNRHIHATCSTAGCVKWME